MDVRERFSFKNQLRLEIFKGIKRLSLGVIVSYLLVISLFILTTKSVQLAQGNSLIRDNFSNMLAQSDDCLEGLGETVVNDFLEGKLSERDIYRKVYENLGQLSFSTSLSLYSLQGERLFTTNSKGSEIFSSDGFIRMVFLKLDSKPASRVIQDFKGQRKLLRIFPVLSKKQTIAYLVLEIESQYVEDFLEVEGVSYLLADRFNNFFTSNNKAELTMNYRKVNTAWFNGRLRIKDGNLYLVSAESIEENIWLYSFILAVPLLPLAVFVVVISVVVFLLLHRTAKHLSRTIALHSSDAVDVLVTDLDLIMDGYQSELAVETDDEFGYLAQKINSMIHTLQSIFRQSLELEKEKTQYQRRMLEAQFNPHFLYNSLESLKILMAIDTQKAERMILAMNRVLRYSVASHQDNSCVEDDFDVLEDFLMVNAIRFEGLTYALNYPDTMARLRVPKLFLLPLVENALKYGMKDSSTLTITITAKEEAGEFLFVVQDSGAGFSDAFLANIASYLKTGGSQHGLINSYKRLEMMYSSSKLVVEKNRVILKIEKRQACINSLL